MNLVYTQHQGAQYLKQQDCMWTGDHVIQLSDQSVVLREVNEELLIGLADGVSASPCAELASKLVMSELNLAVQKHDFSNKAVRYLHERLSAKFSRTRCVGASTTLLVVSASRNQLRIMSVGDSRAYLVDKGNNLELLTKDHSFINQMIEEGKADEQVDYGTCYNVLTDCLVADPEEFDFNIFARTIAFKLTDRLFICTDGVYDTLGKKLSELFDYNLSIEAQAVLVRKAVLENNPVDNFSFMILER